MNKACIPILMYHSISSPKKGSKMRGLSVPKKLFTRQMQILNFLGYRGLSLEKLEPYLLGKKTGKQCFPCTGNTNNSNKCRSCVKGNNVFFCI